MRKPRHLFLTLTLVLMGAAVFSTAGLWYWAKSSPKPPLFEKTAFSRAIEDRDGNILRMTLSDDGVYRLKADRGDLTPVLVDAVLLYEDKWFYKHPGVNPYSIARAAFSSFTGSRPIGGSTITMQVARMAQGLHTRTPEGKIRQILEAFRYEAHYSKDDILAAYLTMAPYGGNIEGINAASWLYFEKPARKLSVNEAVALSVVPQNPVKRNPVTGKDFQRARIAAGKRVMEAGIVTKRIAPALEAPLIVEKRKTPFHAPHFTRLIEKGIADYTSVPSMREKQSDNAGVIETTLSLPLNRAIEGIVADTVKRSGRYGIHNAAVLVADAHTMEVLGYVGSADFHKKEISGEVDGIRAARSPGSLLKPFIYALAADQGLIHSHTVLMDAPSNYAGYEPLNEDRRFEGPLCATDALNRSRNIPAVGLAKRLRPDLYDFLPRVGIALPHEREHYGLSIVLGGAEARLCDIAAAYGIFMNAGVYSPLRYTKDAPFEKMTPVITREAAVLVREMLKAGGRRVTIDGTDIPLFWKTGTSNGYRDAWTVGFAGPYIIGVWTGNFSGKPSERLRGATAALPLWKNVAMRTLTVPELTPDAKEKDYWDGLPDTVTTEEVCRTTGDLAVDANGRTRCADTIPAFFIPGKSPIADSGYLKEIRVDPVTGLRTCPAFKGLSESRFAEVWPEKWVATMKANGIDPAPLPAFHPDCLSEKAPEGPEPVITEPLANRVYTADPADNTARVRLCADLRRKEDDGALPRIFWFAEGRSLGVSTPGTCTDTRLEPGRWRITALGENGRETSAVIRVIR